MEDYDVDQSGGMMVHRVHTGWPRLDALPNAGCRDVRLREVPALSSLNQINPHINPQTNPQARSTSASSCACSATSCLI